MSQAKQVKGDIGAKTLEARQILQWFKNNDFKRTELKVCLSKAEALKALINNMKREVVESEKHVMVSALAKTARAVVDMWNFSNAKKDNVLLQSYCTIVQCLETIAEVSSSYCQHVIRQGIIQIFLADLAKPEFLESRKASPADEVRKNITVSYLNILHIIINLHSISDGANAIRNANGIEILSSYADTDFDNLKMQVIFVLAAVVNDDEQKKLVSLIETSNVALIIDNLDPHKREKSKYKIQLVTLLSDIGMVANFSQRFVELLVSNGVLQQLERIIKGGDGNKVTYTVEEKTQAAKCCWSFTFYEVGRNAISSNEGLMEALRQCAKEQNSGVLSKTCSGVLWGMRSSQNQLSAEPTAAQPAAEAPPTPAAAAAPVPAPAFKAKRVEAPARSTNAAAPAPTTRALAALPPPPPQALAPVLSSAAPVAEAKKPQSDQAQKGHVMLSYSWTSQAAVLRINEFLQAKGVKTWIDVNEMKGSTVEAMAKAVEDATTVVICFSQAYYQSANCRAEAEYAFSLKKPIIPARMENYKASGWLGLILGSKLYYDFADELRFQDGVSRLLSSLVDIFPIDILSIESEPVRKDVGLSLTAEPAAAKLRPFSADGSAGVDKLDAVSTQVRNVVASWSHEHVHTWLMVNGLESYAANFQKFDGEAVLGLVIISNRAPNVLYKMLREEMKLDLLGLTRFVTALHKLSTRPKDALND